MTRHPTRWSSMTFGLLFLAGVGNWAVWKQDLLTPRELSLTTSAALIFLGLLGVIATLRPARVPELTTTPTDHPEGNRHEEVDPQH